MSIRIATTETSAPSTIDEIRSLAAGRLKSLVRNLSNLGRTANELHKLRTMIESLPLTSGEFCVAVNRLRNAQRYLCSDEIGAASYELRLLLGSLYEQSRLPVVS
jgi:hypothetical protein